MNCIKYNVQCVTGSHRRNTGTSEQQRGQTHKRCLTCDLWLSCWLMARRSSSCCLSSTSASCFSQMSFSSIFMDNSISCFIPICTSSSLSTSCTETSFNFRCTLLLQDISLILVLHTVSLCEAETHQSKQSFLFELLARLTQRLSVCCWIAS